MKFTIGIYTKIFTSYLIYDHLNFYTIVFRVGIVEQKCYRNEDK